MSFRMRLSLRCDGPLCSREQASLMPQAETIALEVAALEDNLTRDGWTQLGEKHYCPRHGVRGAKGPITISAAAGRSSRTGVGAGPTGAAAAAVRFGGKT